MFSNRTIAFIIIAATCAASVYALEASETKGQEASRSNGTSEKIDYTPKIHGVVRARWEGEFSDDDFSQRFQVRNARLSVSGNILQDLSYFVQADISDRGKFVFLDAYARWGFAGNWRVQAGQFRVPYGVDCFRIPGGYYFPNRSFLGKTMMNMREVGAKIGYYGTKIPLTVEAGIFNTADKSNHEVWQKGMTYAAKAAYKIQNITITAGAMSAEPDSVRINLIDGAVTWESNRWIVEGEYQYKHYENDRHKAAHGWNLFASYSIPLKKTVFNQLSFQGRFDGMTDHSTGVRNANKQLITNNPARKRITVGTTIAHNMKTVRAALHLNYEKYFYDNNISAPKGEGDKIVAELVVKF